MKKRLIVLAVGAVLFTACGSTTDPDPISTDPVENVGGSGLSASDVVDFQESQEPGTTAEFCYLAGVGDIDATRDAFVRGFISEYPDVDFANEVFDELLSRC